MMSHALSVKINKIIDGKVPIYDATTFENIYLSNEIKQLLEKQRLTNNEVRKLNRLLLEAILPEDILVRHNDWRSFQWREKQVLDIMKTKGDKYYEK